jgi:hypothetical protein
MLFAGGDFLKDNYTVQVEEKMISCDLYYDQIVLLTYTIRYPQFSSDKFPKAINKMNEYYRDTVTSYQLYFEGKLFCLAIEQYQDAIANNYPVMKFETYVGYTITYNQDCTVSLYCDNYEFTGGANGTTMRFSDTWDLDCAGLMKLCTLFTNPNYQTSIIENINRQIAEQIKNGTNQYFENYPELVAQNFNQDNFYLTPQGVVIYFQEIDIAPHSSGIPVFTIPFCDECAMRPCCR